MKRFMLAMAAVGVAGLSGCAVYPAPGYGAYGNAGAAYPVETQPVYIYGTGTYRNGGYAHPRAYSGRGKRDQDRDGVPNRYDRDRDGDGVPNRYDARPANPYRR